jgi:hypothetical protein
MRRTITTEAIRKIVAGVLALLIFVPAGASAHSDMEMKYPKMAPLDEYLMNRDAEIALARSAAPASISDGATVMVMGRDGYTTAVQGTNGFLCLVGRSWSKPTNDPEFWNPKLRSPNCFNAVAAKSVAPVYLTKTRLVLAGKSKTEIDQDLAAALDHGEVAALEPGGMCYMMSKEQYLNDAAKSWHPHVMFFVAGDVPESWGANLPGSPVIAAHDPDARVTVFMVVVRHWSDGTLASMDAH